jgi:glucokinase
MSEGFGSGFTIGLDLGGTDLKSARVFADGRLEGFRRIPSRTTESAEAPFDAMIDSVRALSDGAAPHAIGLGCPGVVDGGTGMLVGTTAHLPHWEDVALAGTLASRTGRPAIVDNDANCAALAEARIGAGRGASVVLMLTLGTGIGCGLVIDGRIHQGAHGGAGELAHSPLGDGSLPCACGVRNCVEPEASGSGLVRRARTAGLGEITAEQVFALAASGDARARALIERFADRLAALLATAVHLVDPELVVIGGGVAQAGETLFEPLRIAFRGYALPTFRDTVRLVPALLGERAGVVGAGLLGWQLLDSNGR